jgi:hypothetical protein
MACDWLAVLLGEAALGVYMSLSLGARQWGKKGKKHCMLLGVQVPPGLSLLAAAGRCPAARI